MQQHPLILAYEQTYDRSFPLILVIGREPNNNSISDGNLGLYDFVAHPKCAFWNVAFSIYGKLNGMTCNEAKQVFITAKASPIVFADAFSQGIHNAVANKNEIRLTQLSAATTQIDAIFNHTNVIERTKLIILSGLSSSIYDEFKALLQSKLQSYNISVKALPFFYPTNTPKIVQELYSEDVQAIQQIHQTFFKEINTNPTLQADKVGKYELDAPQTSEGIILPS